MATTDKISYGASTSITCTLNSLANSTTAGRGSASVDNSTNLYDDAMLSIAVQTGASGLTAPNCCYVYIYGSSADGLFLGSSAESEGTDAAVTLDTPTNLLGPFVLNAPAASITYRLVIGSIASVFGGVMPYKWGFVLQNQTGAALAASGNTAVYTGITYTNA